MALLFALACATAVSAGERETRILSGWTVHVSRHLLTQEASATARALEILQSQLEDIVRTVPAPAVARLQEVPLWLSPEYPGIKPKAGGTYDRVERQDANGRKSLDRAYALTNPQEYFAETTEAFFGRNDFFPYTHEQLRQHDPAVCALLATVWGGTPSPPSRSLPLQSGPKSSR